MCGRVLTYITPHGKGKVVHAIETQGRSKGIASFILNFNIRWR
jgi:hypothetical protein